MERRTKLNSTWGQLNGYERRERIANSDLTGIINRYQEYCSQEQNKMNYPRRTGSKVMEWLKQLSSKDKRFMLLLNPC